MSLWDLSYPVSDSVSPTRPPAPVAKAAGPARFSLDAWERLSPLEEEERRSIAFAAGAPVRETATETAEQYAQDESLPFLPAAPSTLRDHPLADLNGFNDWYDALSEAADSHALAQVASFLNPISAHIAVCDGSLARVDDCRGLIREVEANWKFVDENAESMERACEGMLAEQKLLKSLAHTTSERLGYFRRLEEAQRLLSLPGEDDVLNRDEFVETLDRLEVCLDFMKANRAFRDADLYLLRFQQCLTRAMTLIKIHFVSVVSSIGRDVLAKMSGKELSDSATTALLYTKFVTSAPALRRLLYQLEKRAVLDGSEYGSLASECFHTWFGLRAALVSPGVALEVRRIDNVGQAAGLAALTTTGCQYLRNVCAREHAVFRDFFAVAGDRELQSYMEVLCDCLFDVVRPRILHEQNLDVLCELSTALQALMALDPQPDEVADPTSPLSRPSSPGPLPWTGLSMASPSANHPARFQFEPMLRPILLDVQTRLVFRSEAIVQSEVLRYSPTDDDLAPMRTPTSKPTDGSGSSRPSLFADTDAALRARLPPEEVQRQWYPTVRTTVWVLSRIHSFVNSSVFEDFAAEAITHCRQSLAAATQLMQARAGGSGCDAFLFQVRQMLVLKELVRSLDLVRVEKGIDLGTTTSVLTDLLRNSTAFLSPNALLRLAQQGLPSFADATNAKLDLDGHLRASCEAFVADVSRGVCSGLLAFLTKAATFLSSAAASATAAADLPSQEWATADAVKTLYDGFWATAEEVLPQTRERMAMYLESQETIRALSPLLQRDVLTTYTTWHNLVVAQYSRSTSDSLAHPSEAESRLARLVA